MVISYEEYYPYGSTSFQSGRSGAEVSLKRYRYTGKERDEETGMYYHGARYYLPWLARWCAADPMEDEFAGSSPYNYCHDNPVKLTDTDGKQPGGDPKNVGDNNKNTPDGGFESGKASSEKPIELKEVVIKPTQDTAKSTGLTLDKIPIDLPSSLDNLTQKVH